MMEGVPKFSKGFRDGFMDMSLHPSLSKLLRAKILRSGAPLDKYTEAWLDGSDYALAQGASKMVSETRPAKRPNDETRVDL